MSPSEKSIQVYADWDGLSGPTFMGTLHVNTRRGAELVSFEYEQKWLESPMARVLDPDIKLIIGRQYLVGEKYNFGMFMDSAPDRWGQTLMRKRESMLALRENCEERKLTPTDFLLGVFDEQRVGALRFKIEGNDNFQNDNRELAAPPWTHLRELEHAARQIEDDAVDNDEAHWKWLNMLIAPGSSLGGARPKAGVRDTSGALWIAKFPSKNDDTDVGAWEMVMNDLGRAAGLRMADGLVKRFASKQHTYLTKRFDRTPAGLRIHFASAMTLLGYKDGTNFKDGASYLDLVRFITQNGSQVADDLEELFRRIAFSICVSNTDDHLRNHGFLLERDGWKLSPAYDINPNSYGDGLSLNISESANLLDLGLLKSQAPAFRITAKRAEVMVDEVQKTVATWESVAAKHGIAQAGRQKMAKAFTNHRA